MQRIFLSGSKNTAKGTKQERLVADYLKEHVSRYIDRRPKTGSKDKGDIANLEAMLQPIVMEVKNTARVTVSSFLAEAEAERINDGALAGVVCYKRTGKGKAEDQIVMMTLRDFVAIITGTRPD